MFCYNSTIAIPALAGNLARRKSEQVCSGFAKFAGGWFQFGKNVIQIIPSK